METYKKVKGKNGTIKERKGLLRYKNVAINDLRKDVQFNRDLNGSMNIQKKAKNILMRKKIQPWLERPK